MEEKKTLCIIGILTNNHIKPDIVFYMYKYIDFFFFFKSKVDIKVGSDSNFKTFQANS